MKFDVILRVLSVIVLLFVPIYFGYVGKAIEMGLIIGAGFLGLVFSSIDKFESFKAGGVEAKMRAQLIDAVIEKEIESDYSQEIESAEIEIPNLDLVPDSAQKVVLALHDPNYTWRFVSGISKSTGLDKQTIKIALKWLSDHGYAKKSIGKSGEIWALTSEGRTLYLRIRFKGVQGGIPR